MARSENDLQKLQRAYHLLEVRPTASAFVIKQSYRQLAKRWHPDKWLMQTVDQHHATEKMKDVNSAYMLIRHAPLRYHGSTIDEEKVGRDSTSTLKSTSGHGLINDGTENVVRFFCGAIIGFVLALVFMVKEIPGAIVYTTCIPTLFGWLAMHLGDNFWLELFDFFLE